MNACHEIVLLFFGRYLCFVIFLGIIGIEGYACKGFRSYVGILTTSFICFLFLFLCRVLGNSGFGILGVFHISFCSLAFCLTLLYLILVINSNSNSAVCLHKATLVPSRGNYGSVRNPSKETTDPPSHELHIRINPSTVLLMRNDSVCCLHKIILSGPKAFNPASLLVGTSKHEGDNSQPDAMEMKP